MYISKTPNISGGYSVPQSNPFAESVILPDSMLQEFLAYNGFVHLSIVGDTVTGITPNTEAWEAWKAEEAAKPKPEEVPTQEERIAALEAAMLAVMMGGTSSV